MVGKITPFFQRLEKFFGSFPMIGKTFRAHLRQTKRQTGQRRTRLREGNGRKTHAEPLRGGVAEAGGSWVPGTRACAFAFLFLPACYIPRPLRTDSRNADCFLFAGELAIRMKKRGGRTHPNCELDAPRVAFFKGGEPSLQATGAHPPAPKHGRPWFLLPSQTVQRSRPCGRRERKDECAAR